MTAALEPEVVSAAAKPSSSVSEDDRAKVEDRVKKNEKLLSELADKGSSVPQESAGAFKALLQWLMRLLGRFGRALTGPSNGSNAYAKAADDLEAAKTPAEMAAIAKQASLASKEDSAAVRRMTEGETQSRVSALLQARAGLDAAEATIYAQLASGQFKPAPEQEDILAAALESQAQVISELNSESETMLEQIRRALRIRGNVSLDVDKLNLGQLTDLAKQSNLPDVLKLCEHAMREAGEIKLLKDTATKTYKAAWDSMMPLEKVHGAASRIWTADELESQLKLFEKKDPETAKQRELLEQSQIASKHAGDASQMSPAGRAMSRMTSGNTDELRRKAAEDAAKAEAARKAAQANLTEAEDQASKRAQNQAASAKELKRIQALDASGEGRVLGQDGKPLADSDREAAQKAAQDAIAKAQGISSTVSVVAPVVSVVNPAAGATLAAAGTAIGAVSTTASTALNLAEIRARVQANLRPEEIGREIPDDPYAAASRTVRSLAKKAGQVDGQGPMASDGVKDDGVGDLPDAPKPAG